MPLDRAPRPITQDPSRGTFPACVLPLAADPASAAGWVAAAFREHRWKARGSEAARREGADLWEIGGPVRAFLLDDHHDVVLRRVLPRAAAWMAHGQAVSQVVPAADGRPVTTVTLSLVHGMFDCRESLAAVARSVCATAARAGALAPDAAPTWSSAYDLPPGSPGDPRSRKRLFRG